MEVYGTHRKEAWAGQPRADPATWQWVAAVCKGGGEEVGDVWDFSFFGNCARL